MIKEIPILFSTEMVQAILAGRKTMTRRIVKMYATSDAHPLRQIPEWLKENKTCPYGQPGDLLWVRETWSSGFIENTKPTGIRFKADDVNYNVKWKPSLFMKKEISRIWLQVTDITVERLQEISEEDAISEGVFVYEAGEAYRDYKYDKAGSFMTARGSFLSLWATINGDESLIANPWVWVVKFKVLSTTGKPANL